MEGSTQQCWGCVRVSSRAAGPATVSSWAWQQAWSNLLVAKLLASQRSQSGKSQSAHSSLPPFLSYPSVISFLPLFLKSLSSSSSPSSSQYFSSLLDQKNVYHFEELCLRKPHHKAHSWWCTVIKFGPFPIPCKCSILVLYTPFSILFWQVNNHFQELSKITIIQPVSFKKWSFLVSLFPGSVQVCVRCVYAFVILFYFVESTGVLPS